MPSKYSNEYYNEIHEVMRAASEALGINNGIVKGDLVLHQGKVKVIEIAARMSGGFFGTVATPVSCGVDLISLNIQYALGEKINIEKLSPALNKASAIRFSFPNTGIIKNIAGFENLENDENCCYAHIFVQVGDRIEPITNHPSRPAVVVAKGDNLAQAIINCERLINSIKFEMKDE